MGTLIREGAIVTVLTAVIKYLKKGAAQVRSLFWLTVQEDTGHCGKEGMVVGLGGD